MADAKKRGSRNDKPYRRPRKKVCNFCVDKIDEIDLGKMEGAKEANNIVIKYSGYEKTSYEYDSCL